MQVPVGSSVTVTRPATEEESSMFWYKYQNAQNTGENSFKVEWATHQGRWMPCSFCNTCGAPILQRLVPTVGGEGLEIGFSCFHRSSDEPLFSPDRAVICKFYDKEDEIADGNT